MEPTTALPAWADGKRESDKILNVLAIEPEMVKVSPTLDGLMIELVPTPPPPLHPQASWQQMRIDRICLNFCIYKSSPLNPFSRLLFESLYDELERKYQARLIIKKFSELSSALSGNKRGIFDPPATIICL